MAKKKTGTPNYDPGEIAIAVIALEEGHTLRCVAAYLGQDRSGLLKALKSLGYPTRPPAPTCLREAVEDAIASIDVVSRYELRAQIRELRPEGRTRPPT